MLRISDTVRIMLYAIIGLAVFFALVGIAIIFFLYPFERPLPFLTGLAVGAMLSVAKLFLMEKSISKTLDMENERATGVARLHFLLRYLLTGVVLVPVVLYPRYFGLFGTLAGILTLQLSAYVYGAIERRREEKRFAIEGTPPPLPFDDEETETDY